MTIEEAIELVRGFAEGRAKKFNLDAWADLEIQDIVNRKRWWWRKKRFSYSLVVGDRTKDLNDSDAGIATDFHEMIDLRVLFSDGTHQEVRRETDPAVIQGFYASGLAAGDPGLYIIEPGTTQTLRFDRPHSTARTLAGIYWAAHDPVTPGDNIGIVIPLIPRQYHYVVVRALKKRIFEYLYGQDDPRYPVAVDDFEKGIEQLEAYKDPSTKEGTALVTGPNNPHAVQSTR